jgi:L-fuculose-phosphate aldolase
MDRSDELALRRAIVAVGRLLYERKLVVATDGNISVRLDQQHILITPAGFCKGSLSEADIIRVPLTAQKRSRNQTQRHQGTENQEPELSPPRHQDTKNQEPVTESGSKLPHSKEERGSGASSETPMHVATYLVRPDVSAIVHAHPPHATSFAVSGRKLDSNLLPETRIFDGPVGRVPHLPPGSERLAESVARVLTRHRFCLLGRHGAVSVGQDLLEAYYRLERLEFLAQVTLLGGRR